MNAVSINNYELGIKEYNSQRVVTFKDIDLVHERNLGTARRNFNSNKKHFIENEDYYMLKPNVRNSYIEKIPPKGVTLITETGYLMLVKSFTDDLAWEVQRKLVKSYFRGKEETAIVPVPVTTVVPKTYKGDLILTVNDLEGITGIRKINTNYNLKHSYIFVKGIDFKLLKDADLVEFKRENSGQFINANTLNVIYLSGAEKMLKYASGDKEEILERLRRYYKVAQPKPAGTDDLPQRYARITEAQLLLDTADKISDPYYKEYVYKSVTGMMMEKKSGNNTNAAKPVDLTYHYKLAELLARTDKKGREYAKNKIIADLKKNGGSDESIASANEFFILAESVLAE